MADVQPALVDVAYPPAEATGAWVRPCGVAGPYAMRRPTATMPNRLEIVTCTRPDGHPGAFHQHAAVTSGVICQWGRDGKPDWPPVLKARGE